MKNILLTIVGLLISGMSYSQLSVKKVTSEVALDGLLEESFWDISNQIAIGGSNNTANFGVLWDDNYLYVGVDVTDGFSCTRGGQGWYNDGVEIYIDGNNSQGTSFDSYDRIFVKPVKSYWIQELEERFDGVIHKWMETSSGYSMEFAIPWSNFSFTPTTGASIGFNVAINDDDICNDYPYTMSFLTWSGNSNYYNNPSTWGTLNLSSETVSYSAGYIAIASPKGADFCINRKITEINWVSNGITNVDIDYSTDNGSNWNSIATNLAASSGSFNWNVSASPSEQCLIRISETGNQSFNDISESQFTISAVLTTVGPLIPNAWDNFQWPYNAYFPEDAGGINGHVGSACGHASLARILHYWEFPIVGNDELTFTDNTGHVWSANFGTTTYNYDNMPNYLAWGSAEPEYTDVATLTYHAATSMHDIYGSGGDLAKMSYAMSHYFNYKVSTPTLRNDYTRDEWMNILINELDNGRVLLVNGMTSEVLSDWHENNSCAGHWFHIDGYNEDGQFHGVLGFGNEDTWFDIDSLFNYCLNNGILVGLEPNLNGKELSLQTHNGGEDLQADQVSQINWNSVAVSNIRIEYTIDNGENWIEIINSTNATTGMYNWTMPSIVSSECKMKITDVDNINVYDKSNNVFSITPYELELTNPNNGGNLIVGDLVQITWANTPVANIKIEFSSDNGSNWDELSASYPASSGNFAWTVPDVSSNQCLIKITDVTDVGVFDVSNIAFEILDETSHALQFDGINDFIEVAGFAIPQSDLTIEAWIKPTSLINNSTILAGNTGSSGFEMRVESDGSLLYGEYQPWNYVKSSNNSIPINVWTHVAVTRQGTDGILYVNGEVVATYQLNTDKASDALYIGSKKSSGQDPFEGLIDEVRIWSVARTQSELIASTNTYLNGVENNLFGYWRINEYTGQTTYDLTTNAFNGQLGSTINTDNNDPIYIETNWPYSVMSNTFEPLLNNQVLIYPNPTKGIVFIEVPNQVDFTISTITGQVLIEKKSFTKGVLDISGFNKGIYIIIFEGKSNILTKKLIVE